MDDMLTDEYRLLRKLGRGGMGEVWEAARVKDHNVVVPCAIKLLHADFTETTRERKLFMDEARIATQLDHSRIVKVIDVGTDKHGRPFLVMERVDGIDLRNFLKEAGKEGLTPLDIDITTYIVGEVLAGLDYAHERTIGGADAGVIHSDVTPGNIMISSSGEIKLTDFGIARFAATAGPMSRAIGTPRYMSPEQLSGDPRRETDIYGLGVVLHEMLDGQRFLDGCTPDQFRGRVLMGPPPELERTDVPAWLDDLRRRMLATDLRARPRASEARAVMIQNCPRYLAASELLKNNYYARLIGRRRSGVTQLLQRADNKYLQSLLPQIGQRAADADPGLGMRTGQVPGDASALSTAQDSPLEPPSPGSQPLRPGPPPPLPRSTTGANPPASSTYTVEGAEGVRLESPSPQPPARPDLAATSSRSAETALDSAVIEKESFDVTDVLPAVRSDESAVSQVEPPLPSPPATSEADKTNSILRWAAIGSGIIAFSLLITVVVLLVRMNGSEQDDPLARATAPTNELASPGTQADSEQQPRVDPQTGARAGTEPSSDAVVNDSATPGDPKREGDTANEGDTASDSDAQTTTGDAETTGDADAKTTTGESDVETTGDAKTTGDDEPVETAAPPPKKKKAPVLVGVLFLIETSLTGKLKVGSKTGEVKNRQSYIEVPVGSHTVKWKASGDTQWSSWGRVKIPPPAKPKGRLEVKINNGKVTEVTSL